MLIFSNKISQYGTQKKNTTSFESRRIKRQNKQTINITQRDIWIFIDIQPYINLMIKQAITGAEIYDQAKILGINYVEEIEEKGYEIAFVNSKLVLKKKDINQKIQRDLDESMTQSDLERKYISNMKSYKEKIFYDLFFDKAKINSDNSSSSERLSNSNIKQISQQLQNVKLNSPEIQGPDIEGIQRRQRQRIMNPLSEENENQFNFKNNSDVQINLSFEDTSIQKNNRKKKKGAKNYKNLQASSSKQICNFKDLSCFTSEPSSPDPKMYLKNGLNDDSGIQSPQTPMINSFNKQSNKYNNQYLSKGNQSTIKAQYFSDKEILSDANKKNKKNNQHRQKSNKQNLKPQKVSTELQQKQKRNNSSSNANLLTDKIQNRKENSKILKAQNLLNQNEQFSDIKIQQTKSSESSIDDMDDYQDYKSINIFEQYDDLFLDIEKQYHEQEQEQEQKENQINNSQLGPQQNERQEPEQDKKRIDRSKLMPRKLKCKGGRRNEKINQISIQNNMSTKIKNKISQQPLSILNQSNFYIDYY